MSDNETTHHFYMKQKRNLGGFAVYTHHPSTQKDPTGGQLEDTLARREILPQKSKHRMKRQNQIFCQNFIILI